MGNESDGGAVEAAAADLVDALERVLATEPLDHEAALGLARVAAGHHVVDYSGIQALRLAARVHAAVGNPGAASEPLRRAVAAARLLPDPHIQRAVGLAEIELGELASDMGDQAAALAHYQSADKRLSRLSVTTDSGSSILGLYAAAHLAATVLESNDPETARRTLARALARWSPLGPVRPPRLDLEFGLSDEEAELLRDAESVAASLVDQLGLQQGSPVLHALFRYARRRGDESLAPAAAARVLGHLYAGAGRVEEARQYLTAALEMARSQQRVAPVTLGVLAREAALAADRAGEHAVAIGLYDDALALLDMAGGPAEELLLARHGRAELARVTGDIERALADLPGVAEGARLAGMTDLAGLAYEHLASALGAKGRMTEADRAIATALDLAGNDRPRAIHVLFTRVSHAVSNGDYASATRDLGTLERLVGPDGPKAPDILRWRGHVFAGEGRAADAVPLFDRALSIYRTRGAEPAVVATTQASMAWGLWAIGRHAEALEALEAAAKSGEEVLTERLRSRSILEISEHLQEPWPLVSAMLTLVASQLPQSTAAVGTAFRVAVSRKRLQAEVAAAQQRLIIHDDPVAREASDVISDVTRAGRDASDPTTIRTAAEELARRTPGDLIARVVERSTADAIAAALPSGSVLIEIVLVAGIHDDGVHEQVRESPWYAAFVLHGQQPDTISMVDLGPSDEIDALIDDLQTEFVYSSPRDARVEQPDVSSDARGGGRGGAVDLLSERVWYPLADTLRDSVDVVLALDGRLSSVPFDLLRDRRGGLLIDSHTLSLVAVGRDVLMHDTQRNLEPADPLIIGDPDYDFQGPPNGRPYVPLPATRGEALRVGALIGSDPLLGRHALGRSLLQAERPEIIHLATHADAAVTETTEPALMAAQVAFAGANHPAAAEQLGGRVTAMDVLRLPLINTDLVVLSACRTGVGPIHPAEGALTLGRSFLLAGARSAVVTLWRIDDAAAAELVTLFYLGLVRGDRRAEALAAAKRQMRRRHPGHPEHWAGFVLIGDRDPLIRYRSVMVPADEIPSGPPRRMQGGAWIVGRGRLVDTAEVPLGPDGASFRIACLALKNFFRYSHEEDERKALELIARARTEFMPVLMNEMTVEETRERIADSVHDQVTQAVEILDAIPHGRQHDLAYALLVLGFADTVLDRPAHAQWHFHRELYLREALVGDSHPSLIPALDNLALATEAVGDTEAARPLRARADELRLLFPSDP